MAPPSRFSPEAPVTDGIPLVPERDVVVGDDGGLIATSREPWLRLVLDGGASLDRWVELIYDASLLAPLARPLLRCLTPHGVKDEILPGPMFGRAIWLGMIPARTSAIWISPTDQPGPFRFHVVGLRGVRLAELARRGLRLRPGHTLLGLGLGLAGQSFLAERLFRRALMATPLKDYPRWRELRRRAPAWDGLDALPAEAAQGPHIRVILPHADATAIARWLDRLRAQPWPNWSLAAPFEREPTPGEVFALAEGAPLRAALSDLEARDLVVLARPGESWADEALAIAGAAALRDDADLYYADEDGVGAGSPPRLKPDWSPLLAQSVDLVGRAWFARVGWARDGLGDRAPGEIFDLPIRGGPDFKATHIRRVLFTGAARQRAARLALRPPASSAPPSATVIIPTRDRVDLLRECCASLTRVPAGVDFEVVVVDNDSREASTRAYFAELERDTRFRVLARPGPFNFSALCNAAATEARTQTLVFLNNDAEAVSNCWLERLISWTLVPAIGAVGAKLLFPNKRLQHAGVIVGIDGHACHFEHNAAGDTLGYFGRLDVPHELSAVTGACLAVARAKFDAVGGFDAVNLPVEYCDIDLCLRLAERGWGALLEPAAVLIHHESATRKASLMQERRYAAQVAYFKSRWRRRLRQDPYFHPALSLDWHGPALG
jgi:GT2 family glycosyltransferase